MSISGSRKTTSDLNDTISSLVTEEGFCDTQTYYKYETLPLPLPLPNLTRGILQP
jgi:hypothetical protein